MSNCFGANSISIGSAAFLSVENLLEKGRVNNADLKNGFKVEENELFCFSI